MEKKLEIVFKDVYGGDGNVRYIDVTADKVVRTKSSTTTRHDIGVPVKDSTDEVISEVHKQDVQTFIYDNGNEMPLLRLGGAYGKFWGVLREIALRFYHLGEPVFNKGALPIVKQIQIKPVLVPMEILKPMQIQRLPQKLAGGSAMITMYYDVIPTAKCQITLTYPEKIEKQVQQLLAELPFTSMFNKRRATIESIEDRSPGKVLI